MWKARISVPSKVSPGTAVTVKTLIAHPMETGFRRDAIGAAIPRDILTRFEARFMDEFVFGADLHPGIAANPYLSFEFVPPASGTLALMWRDQRGQEVRETRSIEIAAT